MISRPSLEREPMETKAGSNKVGRRLTSPVRPMLRARSSGDCPGAGCTVIFRLHPPEPHSWSSATMLAPDGSSGSRDIGGNEPSSAITQNAANAIPQRHPVRQRTVNVAASAYLHRFLGAVRGGAGSV